MGSTRAKEEVATPPPIHVSQINELPGERPAATWLEPAEMRSDGCASKEAVSLSKYTEGKEIFYVSTKLLLSNSILCIIKAKTGLLSRESAGAGAGR